eukprot:7034957-Alexandrium_andersonii.AAC.1
MERVAEALGWAPPEAEPDRLDVDRSALGSSRCGRTRSRSAPLNDRQKWQRYDFIEVGTSDFRTLPQFVHSSDASCPLGFALRTWDPEKI